MTPIRRWSTTAVAAFALLLPAACGSGDDRTISTPAGDVSIDEDDGKVTYEDDEGNSFTTAAELPEGFPEDEIPLVDGEIIQGVSVDQGSSKGYTISIDVEGDVSETYAEAKKLLERAGFASQSESTASGFATSGFDNGTWMVLVTATESGRVTSLSYIVAPTE